MDTLIVAMIINPRYKNKLLATDDKKRSVKEFLKRLFSNIKNK